MKVRINKKEAVALIPTLAWVKTGVLGKKPSPAKAQSVLALVAEGKEGVRWSLYKAGPRYFVCAANTHDTYYEAEAK